MNRMGAPERDAVKNPYHYEGGQPEFTGVLLGVVLLLSLAWHFLCQYNLANTIHQTIRSVSTRLHSALPRWLIGDSEHAMLHHRTESIRKLLGFEGAPLVRSLVQGDRSRFASWGRSPPGLGNWDNSCYQNCIIQGLASLHSLKDFLSAPSMNFHRLEENSTIHSLQETLLKLTDPANGGRQLWLPGKLKSMSSWQQQDAQEYFSKIMEQMDQEARKATTINSLLLGLKDIPDSNETLPDAETASHLQSLRLHNPLEGMLAQRVGCINCGYSEGLSLIPFNCLTVALGRSHLYDIRDCLDEYTKLEPIEGVQCAKCSVQHHLEGCMRMATEKKDGSSLDTFHQAVQTRVNTLRAALNDEDFSDDTLTKKCKIPKRQWVSSTKTRQAVIARPPQCLAFHVNRSVFDEMTGTQWKNYAAVQFPLFLDLDEWGLGSKVVSKPMQEPPSETPNIIPGEEAWIMNPNVTMLPNGGDQSSSEPHWRYRLRAVITHYGRHENGHYICFRKHSGGLGSDSDGDTPTQENAEASKDSWWQLSDEDVVEVSEDNVLSQGGVFMLFYEQVPVDGISVSPDQQQDHSTAEDVHITPPLTEADSTLSLPIPSHQEPDVEPTAEVHRVESIPAIPPEEPSANPIEPESTTSEADDHENHMSITHSKLSPEKPPDHEDRAPARMRTATTPTATFQGPKVRMVSI